MQRVKGGTLHLCNCGQLKGSTMLDRLGRSVRDLVSELARQGIHLKSLADSIRVPRTAWPSDGRLDQHPAAHRITTHRRQHFETPRLHEVHRFVSGGQCSPWPTQSRRGTVLHKVLHVDDEAVVVRQVSRSGAGTVVSSLMVRFLPGALSRPRAPLSRGPRAGASAPGAHARSPAQTGQSDRTGRGRDASRCWPP